METNKRSLHLNTPVGAFDLVTTPADEMDGTITVIAAARHQLDALRASTLPQLGQLVPAPDGRGGWAARVPCDALGTALAGLASLAAALPPAAAGDAPWIGKADLYGAVIVLPGPVFLLRHLVGAPVASVLPLGRCDDGETPDAAVRRAAYAQAGLAIRLLGALPGRFTGPSGTAAFFMAAPTQDGVHGPAAESHARWCTMAEAQALIGQVEEPRARQRDAAVLAAAAAWLAAR